MEYEDRFVGPKGADMDAWVAHRIVKGADALRIVLVCPPYTGSVALAFYALGAFAAANEVDVVRMGQYAGLGGGWQVEIQRMSPVGKTSGIAVAATQAEAICRALWFATRTRC